MKIEKKGVATLRPNDIVILNGEEWCLYGVSRNHHDFDYIDGISHTLPGSEYTVELRGKHGQEIELIVHNGNYTLDVKVRVPWEGLKVGDVLSKRTGYLVVLTDPAEAGDEGPWLMSLDGNPSHPRPSTSNLGYCQWQWYEQHEGPIQRMDARNVVGPIKHRVLGQTFYLEALKGA